MRCPECGSDGPHTDAAGWRTCGTCHASWMVDPGRHDLVKYTHDIPLAELDGQHAKSVDCPCGTDIEAVTPNSAIVYHQRRMPSKRPAGSGGTRVGRILAEVERVAAHKRDIAERGRR